MTSLPNWRRLAGIGMNVSLREQMTQLGRQAKAASRQLARLSTDQKNGCLLAMADALEQNRDGHPGSQFIRHGSRRPKRPVQRHAGPPQTGRQTHRVHGQGIARSGRAAGPGGPGAGRPDPPQRIAFAENCHPHRRRRHHLRIAPQRHRGRGQSLFQIRQRHHPARRQGSDSFQSSHCRNNDPAPPPGICRSFPGTPSRSWPPPTARRSRNCSP